MSVPTPSVTSGDNLRTTLEEGCAKNRWMQKLGELDWQSFFPHVASPSRTPIEQQLYWKLLHRRLPVNAYLKTKGNFVPNRGCVVCGEQVETIEHVFFECPNVQTFWKTFRLYMMKFLQMTEAELPEFTLRDTIFFFPELCKTLVPEELHVLTVCHSVALWAIWSMRSSANADVLLWPCFLSRLEARVFLEYENICKNGNISADKESINTFASRWCNDKSLVKLTTDGIIFSSS
ncbi:hypothetical protein HDV04_000922 [Boothiomyces sp. JEL0838]|nr:hypothetical protein HDV04_000873 [Boothiomyces sp. JEL0838]KAJ3314199.1 hypothetical protein HDV04_000922 [Boothiomyces sp. JEL0838]